jgi:hypothetical protein
MWDCHTSRDTQCTVCSYVHSQLGCRSSFDFKWVLPRLTTCWGSPGQQHCGVTVTCAVWLSSMACGYRVLVMHRIVTSVRVSCYCTRVTPLSGHLNRFIIRTRLLVLPPC